MGKKRANWLQGICDVVMGLPVLVTLALSLLVLMASTARAAEVVGNDIDGWISSLSLPPGVRQIQAETETGVSYRLVLSELKRQSATTFGEQERAVFGDVRRRAWEINGRQDLEELTALFRRQMPEGQLLYQCQSLDCGSSHFWANEIFGNGRLVGRDRYQSYFVWAEPLANSTGQRVYLFYAAGRGSRQTVIGLNVVDTQSPLTRAAVSHAAVEEALASSSGWLPGFVADHGSLDTDASAVLIEVIKGTSRGLKQRLFLTVHCYDDTNMLVNTQCSQRLAEQLRVATYDGVTELPVQGLGALVIPDSGGYQPRLRFVVWPRR